MPRRWPPTAAAWTGAAAQRRAARARAHHGLAQARDRARAGLRCGSRTCSPRARARAWTRCAPPACAPSCSTSATTSPRSGATWCGRCCEELGDGVHVVGLTATPPDELTTEEAELYAALLGPVDFQVPTPAVVRDGHLAPYQELAWLTEPLDGEQRWLDEHETRFRELVTALLDVDESGPLDLGQWVITRLRHRTRPGEDESEVPWSDFQRRHPALAGRRRALPRVRRSPAAARRAARRGVPPPARPRRLGRAARGLGAALPRRSGGAGGRGAPRGGRRRAARPRLPADAHGDPPRGVGRRPAADRLGREAAGAGRGARAPRPRRAGPTCARSCCAMPSCPARARTASCATCSTPTPAPRARPSVRWRTTPARPSCARCWSPAAGCAAPSRTPRRCWRRWRPRTPRRR